MPPHPFRRQLRPYAEGDVSPYSLDSNRASYTDTMDPHRTEHALTATASWVNLVPGEWLRSTPRALTGAAALLIGLISSPAGAQVSGSVFLDRNGNGVRDAGERGVAGVVVSNQDAVVVRKSVV